MAFTLKLLIDNKSKRVLFAEAEKNFIDFLIKILSLSTGTLIRLVTEDSILGSLGNISHSAGSLGVTYLQNAYRYYRGSYEHLLSPRSYSALKIQELPSFTSPYKIFYVCKDTSHTYGSDAYTNTTLCPKCDGRMNRQIICVPPESDDGCGGFVKGGVKYMVSDDLVFEPMSHLFGIELLNRFDIKDVGALERKVVHLDEAQVLKLLKASMNSKMVLTTVFLDDDSKK